MCELNGKLIRRLFFGRSLAISRADKQNHQKANGKIFIDFRLFQKACELPLPWQFDSGFKSHCFK
jgi:hypothetical protein